MKQLFITVMLLFGLMAGAQEFTPPSKVSSAFKAKYPLAEDVSWYEDEGLFEASFYQEDQSMTAIFDKNANWKETRTYIGEEELDAEITATCESKVPNGYINSIVKLENKEGVFYSIEMEDEVTSYSLKFSEDGKLVKIDKSEEGF